MLGRLPCVSIQGADDLSAAAANSQAMRRPGYAYPMALPTRTRNLAWLGSRWFLLAGLLTGFGLRLHRLGAESLWYDETVSVVLARKPAAELIAHTAGDIHPPGYYLLLHAWQALTDPTLAHGLEFLFAYFSLAFGMAVLALLYAVGRLWFDRSTVAIAVWIAALSPFHLWYSQEVRMYTLAAALGLLALWLTVKLWTDPAHALAWGAAFALTAAALLYTLYYAAFLLIAVNGIALAAYVRSARARTKWANRTLMIWAGAQLAALLLSLPWLPTFLHQAVDPPVPRWRQPWQSGGDVLYATAEALAALLVGQSPPFGGFRLWAVAAFLVMLVAVFGYAKERGQAQAERVPGGLTALLVYLLMPAGLIFAITALGAPIYHVRYLFTFAPPFALVAAAAVTALGRRHAWAGLALLAVITVISAGALAQFWTNPLYRSDDHRAAVADLARNWRPGDVILANAGWVYTILETYWPGELVGDQAALPPLLAASARLPDYAAQLAAAGCMEDATVGGVTAKPVVARTGSVGGGASLGWDNPQSDFFATSAGETAQNLAQLAQCFQRLWHFRLYDTVSDPRGAIRTWLDANTDHELALPYPGRDFLQVELHRLQPASPAVAADGSGRAEFGEALRLLGASAPVSVTAGSTLYAELGWLPLSTAADLSMSLRLYDDAGALVAQRDEAPWPPTGAWPAGAVTRQSLAVGVPAALPPGKYDLELIVYHQADGQPLPVQGGAQVVDGQRLRLDTVVAALPDRVPEVGSPLASFDYIDLLHALPAVSRAAPGDPVGLSLTWRPRPSAYRDDYVATVDLVANDGELAQSWAASLGGDYPSGSWPAGYPVLDRRTLDLRPDLAPGEYSLHLRLSRAGDGLSIPARRGLWPGRTDTVEIGRLDVEP